VLIALDEAGRQLDSAGLARRIARWQEEYGTLGFVIGGPDGLAKEVLDQANATIAFGRMTWPHRLVRVMLAEQVYRASTILSGHPYHRA
jgi:23S rRNA (pseudouridine1915-N3)-methyltransferase